jgi:predicted MFS family arabinose efflux permease
MGPPATQTVAPARPRLLTGRFLLVAVATLAYFTADGVLLPTVPLLVEGPLGGSPVAVGITVGAFSVTALFLRPWAGRLADRRGRRLLMVVGAGVFAVSVVGYLAASSVAVLVLMRLLTGSGEAFFFVGAASAINDLAPEERRGEAVSFFSLALYFGIGIGPVLGEVISSGGAFDRAWLLSAAFGAVAVLLALRIPETRPESDEAAPNPPLVHRAALMPGTILLLGLLGMSAFFTFGALYSRRVGLADSRWVFVMFSGIVILIRSFGARIPDVLGPVTSSRLALATSAAGLAVMGVWRTAPGLFAGTAVLAVGVALTFPALMMLAVRAAPATERGAVIGTFTAFVDLVFGFGPAMLGFVASATGFAGTFLVAAVLSTVGLAMLLRPPRGVTPVT